MSKEKFLLDLESALTNQLPPEEIQAQLGYYKQYIKEQLESGRSESEVMASLGDPYLIANTIIQGQEFEQAKVGGYETRETKIEREIPIYKSSLFWILILGLMLILIFLAIMTKLIFIFWPFILIGIVVYLIYHYGFRQR